MIGVVVVVARCCADDGALCRGFKKGEFYMVQRKLVTCWCGNLTPNNVETGEVLGSIAAVPLCH